MPPLHQSHFHTLPHHLFEQLLKQLRFLKPSVPVFRERGMMRYLLIEAQSGEPAPCQVHAQFLYQLPLTGDAVQVADQQNAQQKLGSNGRTASIAVTRLQLLPHKGKADVLFDQPQQMSLRNLIFQTEVVEQRFGAVVLPHHDQQSLENENPASHVEVLPCFRQISPANLSDFFNTHSRYHSLTAGKVLGGRMPECFESSVLL